MTGDTVDTPVRDTTAGAFSSWALAAALLRAGAVAGLWPVVVGADGVETANLLPFLLHALGALATVVAVAVRRAVLMLIAIAFTGYSTIVLGLGAPGALGAVVWVTGVLAFAALLLAALRPGPVARWAWLAGGALAVVAVIGVPLLRAAA